MVCDKCPILLDRQGAMHELHWSHGWPCECFPNRNRAVARLSRPTVQVSRRKRWFAPSHRHDEEGIRMHHTMQRSAIPPVSTDDSQVAAAFTVVLTLVHSRLWRPIVSFFRCSGVQTHFKSNQHKFLMLSPVSSATVRRLSCFSSLPSL